MKTSILALVVLLAAASACDRGQPASAEVVSHGTTSEEPVPVDQALATASAYLAAFNDGDADAIVALLAETAAFSDSFTGSITRESWERRLAWNLAQRTQITPADCYALPGSATDGGTEIACESLTLNAQIQAVGARPVPTLVRFSVTPDGIIEVTEQYGRPDFLQAMAPFIDWMEDEHPDVVEDVRFGNWDSIADAQEKGHLTREYARSWAAYLEASCLRIPGLIAPHRDSYLDDC